MNSQELENVGVKRLADGVSDTDTDDEMLFNSVIEQIGKNNTYQIRINFLYNFIFAALVALPFSNFVLAMSVPDHWCHAPGREFTNLTVDEWKQLWIPKESKLHSDRETYSSCKMYSSSSTSQSQITDCQLGWEYDRQWFGDTIPASQNWVCNRAALTTHALTATNVGEVIGLFVLGQLEDLTGRRALFYTSLAILMFGRISLVYSAPSYGWFLAFMGIGTAAMGTASSSPLVIAIEVLPDRKQNFTVFLKSVSSILGNFSLPFLAWICRDWRTYMIVTTLPCGLFFFLYKFLPESPRWLASKGRITESKRILQNIAKINNTELPDNTSEVLRKIGSKKVKFMGMATLFTNWRLAKNSVILAVCGVTNGLSSYAIILNATNMEGNPFMNYFWALAADIPSIIIAIAVAKYLPRRWAAASCYFMASLSCLLLIFLYNLEVPGLHNVFVVAIKINLVWADYMMTLQSLAIYPACIRQTGLSFNAIVIAGIGAAGPYIVHLGTNIDARIPFVAIFCLTLNAAICSTFLPETLNENLPETLQDTYVFGKNQKFWSFATDWKRRKSRRPSDEHD